MTGDLNPFNPVGFLVDVSDLVFSLVSFVIKCSSLIHLSSFKKKRPEMPSLEGKIYVSYFTLTRKWIFSHLISSAF